MICNEKIEAKDFPILQLGTAFGVRRRPFQRCGQV